MSTYHGIDVKPGTTHYLSVSADYGNRIHAVAAIIEGGTLMAPFCGVNSLRCNRYFGAEVTCPSCLKQIRQHQLLALAQPWPKCPCCWGHRMNRPNTGIRDWHLNPVTICYYCLGTGIHPAPGQPAPRLPLLVPPAHVSKAGLGYAQCSGCANHRPITHFGPNSSDAFCGACYHRASTVRHTNPWEYARWAVQNLAAMRAAIALK